MSKVSPVKPDEVIRILEKLGFKKVRQSGSHAVFYHSDGRWTTVPIHKGKDVSKGVLRKILESIGLTYEEFKNIK